MKKLKLFATTGAFLLTSAIHAHVHAADEMYAMKTNWVLGLQHTYVCFNSGGTTSCAANPGTVTDQDRKIGTYLAVSRGYGDATKASCASSKNSNCAVVWGITGTCHQGANRMLFTSGKTVANAGGYFLSVRLYGTYGSASSWKGCKSSCKI